MKIGGIDVSVSMQSDFGVVIFAVVRGERDGMEETCDPRLARDIRVSVHLLQVANGLEKAKGSNAPHQLLDELAQLVP